MGLNYKNKSMSRVCTFNSENSKFDKLDLSVSAGPK